MGSYFLIYGEEDSIRFHQLEGQTLDQAKDETREWVRATIQNNPDCHPVVILAELHDDYHARTEAFGSEENFQQQFETVVHAVEASGGNIPEVLELLRKKQ